MQRRFDPGAAMSTEPAAFQETRPKPAVAAASARPMPAAAPAHQQLARGDSGGGPRAAAAATAAAEAGSSTPRAPPMGTRLAGRAAAATLAFVGEEPTLPGQPGAEGVDLRTHLKKRRQQETAAVEGGGDGAEAKRRKKVSTWY